jgi:hypothetical protein
MSHTHGVAHLPGEFVSLILYDDVYRQRHERGDDR